MNRTYPTRQAPAPPGPGTDRSTLRPGGKEPAIARAPAVLIIVENLPVPLDRRVWQEARALRDAGYDVAIICPRMRGLDAAEEQLEGIWIYRHWISEEAGGFGGFLREYLSALWGESWLAWKAWRRHRFRVIHVCNPPDLLFLVALPFKLLFGTRVIYDVHDLWPEMYEAKFGRRGLLYRAVRFAEHLTYACADAVLATNRSVEQVALGRGRKDPWEVFVVRSAPQLPAERTAPVPALKKGRRHLVGYIGVTGSADGVHLLVEAADRIVHHLGRHDVQFLLMGTGPEHARLIALRDRLHLQAHVDLPGRVSNDFLFSALQTIDLGVGPDPINAYNDHCTMNKTLEYMAFGKAQVVFDLKEARTSAGDAARYVPETSSVQLANAIITLLDDAAERERMGRAGAARLRNELGWDRSVEQLLAAYRAALE